MTSAIDVLIPVYNGASTIESALRSIQAQTVRDFRLVVVDDGSTDETPAILARLAADDPRIVVVTTPNGGIVHALNLGLAHCEAPLVARHDADDIAYPDRLARQRAYLEAHPDCVAVGCNAYHIDRRGERTGTITKFVEVVVGDPYYAPSMEPYLMHPFLMVRREALVSAGGYRRSYHSEDTDLYWRLADRGRLANLLDVLGEYRMHPDSISARSIVNGRIAAIHSQRAAVSERRRRAGRTDLDFDRASLADYQRAERLAPMLALAAEGMTADERAYLEIATAAKLLELGSYRPYRLTHDDLRTIRRILARHVWLLGETNRRQLLFRVILGRRLRRKPAEALRLVPWSAMPAATWELARFVWRKRVLRSMPASPATATKADRA